MITFGGSIGCLWIFGGGTTLYCSCWPLLLRLEGAGIVGGISGIDGFPGRAKDGGRGVIGVIGASFTGAADFVGGDKSALIRSYEV